MESELLQQDGAGKLNRAREDAGLIRQALRRGWKVPDNVKAEVVDRLHKVATMNAPSASADESQAKLDLLTASANVQAAKALIDADGINNQLLLAEDKNERLDAGKPTEIQGIKINVPGMPRPDQGLIDAMKTLPGE